MTIKLLFLQPLIVAKPSFPSSTLRQTLPQSTVTDISKQNTPRQMNSKENVGL